MCFLAVALPAFAQQANPGAEAQAGAQALRQGNVASAVQHFKAALKIDPNSAEVRADLALAYYAGHQYGQAVSEFREALKQNSNLQTARAFLPLSLAAAGNCREAVSGLSREFDSTSNPKLRRISGLSLLRCRMEANDNAGAAVTASKLVASFPNDPDVLYMAGQLYASLSNEVYTRLMKVAPHSARTYQLMASVAATSGNWKGAIESYQHALHINPGLQGAHLQIAILMLMHSHEPDAWQKAITQLKEELKVNPSSSEAEYEIGEAYRKHGHLNQAVAAFRRSLQFDPAAVPTRVGLAKALQALGKKQEALATLVLAQKAAPNDPDVHFLLAQLYRALGHPAEARAEIKTFQRLQKASNSRVKQLGQ